MPSSVVSARDFRILENGILVLAGAVSSSDQLGGGPYLFERLPDGYFLAAAMPSLIPPMATSPRTAPH